MIEGKKAIYMAILNQGEIAVELSQWSNSVLMTSEYPVFIDYSCEKPISFNRNQIVKRFLERPQYDYLIMIDSDIVPPPEYFKLVDFSKDIISGLCFAFTKKNIFPLILKYHKGKKENGKYRSYDSMHPDKWTGLVECDAIGTGAIILSRKVLEAIPHPFRNEYDKTGDKLIGLDLNFCHRAKKLGFQVFCHTDYVCSHFTRMDLRSLHYTIDKVNKDLESLSKGYTQLQKKYDKIINRKHNSRKVIKDNKTSEVVGDNNRSEQSDGLVCENEGESMQSSGNTISEV